MMRENQKASVEDRLRSETLKLRPTETESPAEIIRRTSDKVSKKIDKIFAKKETQAN
jgi:hypothetical protein